MKRVIFYLSVIAGFFILLLLPEDSRADYISPSTSTAYRLNGTSNGAVLKPSNNTAESNWRLEKQSDGNYLIKSGYNFYSLKFNGEKFVKDNVKWKIIDNSDGTKTFQNVSNKKYLTYKKVGNNEKLILSDIEKGKFKVVSGAQYVTLHFLDNNNKPIKRVSVKKDGKATAPTAPTVKGYTFSKWDKDLTKVSKNAVVRPVYTLNSYKITYNPNGGTHANPATYNVNSNITLKDATKTGNYKFVGWQEDSERQYVAHRGYSDTAPENTMLAFRLAADKGYSWIETDVYFTKDNIPVLLHDATINRTARNSDGSKLSSDIKIKDITYAEASKYDYGLWRGENYKQPLPKFEEFIKFCSENNIHPMIELKTNINAAQAKIITDIVSKYKVKGMYVAFYNLTNALNEIKKIDTGATTGVFITNDTLKNTTLANIVNNTKNFTYLNLEQSLITAENIKALNGKKIIAWTMDNATNINNLDKTCAFVITNKVEPVYSTKIIKNSTGNKTYTARYKKETIVHYNANGADNASVVKPDTVVNTLPRGGGIQSLILWQKDGYLLSSWNTKADGTGKKYSIRYKDTNKYDNTSFDNKAEVTLYAQYTPAYVRLRHNIDGKITDSYVKTNETPKTQNAPTKTGYTFAGWKYQDGTIKKAGESVNKYPNNTIHGKDDFVLKTNITEKDANGKLLHFHLQGATVYEADANGTGFAKGDKILISGHVNDALNRQILIKWNLTKRTLLAKTEVKDYGHLNDLIYNPTNKLIYTTSGKVFDTNLKPRTDVTALTCSAGVFYNNNFYVRKGTNLSKMSKDAKWESNVSLVSSELADFNNGSVPLNQGSAEKNGVIYSANFIGSGTDNYITMTSMDGKTRFFTYHTGTNQKEEQREIEDLYLDKDKLYVFTATSTQATQDNDIHVQTFSGDGIPTNTLTAQWTPKTVNATFNINIPNDTRTYKETYTYNASNQKFGMKLTDKSGNFGVWKRPGYELLGWSFDKNATTATYSIYSDVSNNWINTNAGNKTLYAIWKPTVTNVTFNINIPGDTRTYKESYTYGKTGQSFGMKLTDKTGSFGTWKRAGYSLLGWSFDKNATASTYSVYSGISNNWLAEYPGNRTLYAVWKIKDTVTPEEFGAKGDGKTDDKAAIEKAVNSGAKNVNFTKTYYIASNVAVTKGNVNLQGGGTIKENKLNVRSKNVNLTKLTFTGSNGGILYNTIASDPAGTYYFNSTVQNCTFKDITGKTNAEGKLSKTYGIHIHGYGASGPQWVVAPAGIKKHVGKITIKNNNFSNVSGMSVCGAGGEDIQILNNTFNNSGSEHITVDWVCKNFKIEGNTFSGKHYGTGAIGVDGAQGLVVNNNTFNSTGAGRANSSIGLNHELYDGTWVNNNITVTNNKFNKCKFGIAKNMNNTGWDVKTGKNPMPLVVYNNKTVIKTLNYSGNTTASGITLYGTNTA